MGRHFESYGEINNVKIMYDRYDKSTGIGYVEFESKGFLNFDNRTCLKSSIS